MNRVGNTFIFLCRIYAVCKDELTSEQPHEISLRLGKYNKGLKAR